MKKLEVERLLAEAQEEEERLLTEAIKLRIGLQNQIKNGVDQTSKEYLESCNRMNSLMVEWGKYYVVRFIKEKEEKDTLKQRAIYIDLLKMNIAHGGEYKLIREHAQELNDIVLAKEKELKAEGYFE